MAKKARKKKSPKPEPFRWQRLLRLLPAVAVVGGLFAGLHWLTQQAGASVAAKERYAVPVADLRVNTPPHTNSAKFLTEVRLLGNLPEAVSSVDPATPTQLADAFRKHPWVEGVSAVTVEADGGVRIELRFRSPVLAVRWNQFGVVNTRAVTLSGVLLPTGVETANLPVLTTVRTVTDAADGRPWPEPDVKRAAELVSRHPCKTIERTRTGWRLIDANGEPLVINAP
ncbi:MAG: hypothetical protein MUF18_08570 [Fimbriiglobus sp.]|nr:hypothetical protein [Fimbriiglobus sp.]